MIEYRRLRAPSEDRQTLMDPSVDDAPHLLAHNQQFSNDPSLTIGTKSLSNLRETGRSELLELACQYTSSYRDVKGDVTTSAPIVMSGHQPNLFHPGVWFKNFMLSELGNRLKATAVNLIVDNDIAGVTSIQVPQTSTQPSSVLNVPIDRAGNNVPFECRSIVDLPFFKRFNQRVTEAISPMVNAPLVQQLWPLVCKQLKNDTNLGTVLAKGRHLLEQEAGLNTLEVPLSQIVQSPTFAELVLEIFQRIDAFQHAYNECLAEYRDIHHIRSNAHPAPKLNRDNGFFETPFWIWNTTRPVRRRLFMVTTDKGYLLTDQAGWQQTIDRSNFIDQFTHLKDEGIAIRPRALLTTLYSRLILSDLFLHGIGGSKYDQLTDAIAQRFFQFDMPKYMTLTATTMLPNQADSVLPADLTRLKVLARELHFHPEDHVDQAQTSIRKLVERKRRWLNQTLPRSERGERHQQITDCNRQLRQFAEPSAREIRLEQKRLMERLRENQILRSREYSFCLYPDLLIDDLKSLARH